MTTQSATSLQQKATTPSFGRSMLSALQDAFTMHRMVSEDRSVSAATLEKVRAVALRS